MDKSKAIKVYKMLGGNEEFITTVFSAKEAMLMHKRITEHDPYSYVCFRTVNNTVIGELSASGKPIKRTPSNGRIKKDISLMIDYRMGAA
tara:strand:- start:442 stop:711 length:270 start_codon:yes stop_codon:yes gene_type:complete